MSVKNFDILIDKLKDLKQYTSKQVDGIVNDYKQNIVGLNKAQMQEKGIKATGELIQPEGYKPFTIRERQKKGLQTAYVDLKYTGKFQDSIDLKKTSTLKYKIDATDPKYREKLLPRYGEILGLTTDNLGKVGKLIEKNLFPKIQNYFKI